MKHRSKLLKGHILLSRVKGLGSKLPKGEGLYR